MKQWCAVLQSEEHGSRPTRATTSSIGVSFRAALSDVVEGASDF
jgi:hypothetical protein